MELECLSEGSWSTCAMVYSLDSKFLFHAIGSRIRVLSTATGETLSTLDRHTQDVSSLAVNPTNPLQLFSSSRDGLVICWDFRDAICLKEYHLNRPVLWMGIGQNVESAMYVILEKVKKEASKKRKHQSTSGRSWGLFEFQPSTETLLQLGKDQSSSIFHQATLRPTDVPCPMFGSSSSTISKNDKCIVAIVAGSDLCVWDPERSQLLKRAHPRKLTCVSIHPTESYQFATGDVRGQITLWHGLNDDDGGQQKHKTKLHWHALPVRCISYSLDGSFLASGGEECVFVYWQLSTGKRSYLPRLGSPVNALVYQPKTDGSMASIALGFEHNAIRQINPTTMMSEWHIRGLVSSGSSLLYSGVVMDPKTGASVVSGQHVNGSLQFINNSTTQVREHVMSLRNQVTKTEREEPVASTLALEVVFSAQGQIMVTLGGQQQQQQFTIKFWKWNRRTHAYEITCVVEDPHGVQTKVTAMSYHPTKDQVTTADAHGTFKVWSKHLLAGPSSMTNSKSTSTLSKEVWTCRVMGQYNHEPVSALSYSTDGSILAMGCGPLVALWDAESAQLKTVLTYGTKRERVNRLTFVSAHLVVETKTSVCIWDVISQSLLWAYRIQVQASVMLREGTFVVIVPDFVLEFNNLGNPVPSKVTRLPEELSKVDIVAVADASTRGSSVLCLAKGGEMWKLHLSGAPSEDASPVVPEPLDDMTTTSSSLELQSMYGPVLKKSKQANTQQPHVELSSVTKGSKANQGMLDAPAHLMPSISSLYESYMDSILIPKNETKEKVSKLQNQDDGFKYQNPVTNALRPRTVHESSSSDTEIAERKQAEKEIFDRKEFTKTYRRMLEFCASG